MEKEQEQLEALQDIRKMMKESSKFLSLSGLSGVFAGIYALIGASIGYSIIHSANRAYPRAAYEFSSEYPFLVSKVILTCLCVLGASLLTAFYFSAKKAKKNHQKLFDHTSKKLLWNMLVPLSAGGIFCLALVYHGNGMILLVSPVMLIFYGLALIACSKFTVHDIKYLGYLELCLGMISAFFLGSGILFWALGFGLLHIVYGSIMWFKYDRQD
jgi:MFS family permease